MYEHNSVFSPFASNCKVTAKFFLRAHSSWIVFTTFGCWFLVALCRRGFPALVSFQEAVQLLSSRLYLLEMPHLDQVEARLSLLQQKMQQLSEKKGLLDELDKAGKVNELYELLKKSDAMGSSLAQVVERLVCLQELHDQGERHTKFGEVQTSPCPGKNFI